MAGRRRADDGGFSLLEVTAAMGVLSVLLVVFVSAVSLMATTTRRSYAAAATATQARSLLDQLSRQLSYASAINTPVYSSSKWYLEFESDAVLAGQDPQCTQWRFTPSSGYLEYRTWDTLTSATQGWRTLTTTMANDPVTQPPFALLPSDAGFSVMRVVLDVRLRSAVGTLLQQRGQYALRNSMDAPVPTSSTVCTQMGRP